MEDSIREAGEKFLNGDTGRRDAEKVLTDELEKRTNPPRNRAGSLDYLTRENARRSEHAEKVVGDVIRSNHPHDREIVDQVKKERAAA